jgi:hypothetical protein
MLGSIMVPGGHHLEPIMEPEKLYTMPIARLTKPPSLQTLVELIWKPISSNWKLIPIALFEFPFRHYTDFNYGGTRWETHGWTNMRKQYIIIGGKCTRTRSQPSMRTTQW